MGSRESSIARRISSLSTGVQARRLEEADREVPSQVGTAGLDGQEMLSDREVSVPMCQRSLAVSGLLTEVSQLVVGNGEVALVVGAIGLALRAAR